MKHGPEVTKTAHLTFHSLHSTEMFQVNPFRVDSYKDDDHQIALVSTADFCDVEKRNGFQPGDEASEHSA